jgi:hypothetical protein
MLTQSEYLNQNPPATAEDHKALVLAAIARGETVSPDVLADYPDLKKKRGRSKAVAKPVIPEIVEPVVALTPPATPMPTNPPPTRAPEKTFAQQVEEDFARQNAIIDEEIRQRDAIFKEEEAESMADTQHMIADINSDISIQDAAIQLDKKIAREDALSDNAQVGIRSDSLFSDKTFAQQVEEDMARQNAIIDEELRQRDAIFREENPSFSPDTIPTGNEEDLLSQIETEGELLEHIPEYNDAGSPLDEFSPDELLKLHLSRSRQAQAIDNRSRNKNAATDQNGYRNWVRNPGKSDIEGIDTPQGGL